MSSARLSHPEAAAESVFLPGPVLLFGAPGVGKGTQAQLFVAEYAIPQISTGDLLRANIARGTALGLEARHVMELGLLVSDALVNQMVLTRLGEKDTERGYILDGYPRTLDQADFLDGTLNAAAALPVIAVSIVVAYDQLLRRITGRRICPTCKSIYNMHSNPSAVSGVCDFDGTALIQRPDDTEPVFAERIKTFEQQTAPVVEHYRTLGRFAEVDGDQQVERVTSAIDAALHRLRR